MKHMSFAVTNRVYLPRKAVQEKKLLSDKVYVSDDRAGDDRLVELYQHFGNLKMEACYKDSGESLDDLKPFWEGTVREFFG